MPAFSARNPHTRGLLWPVAAGFSCTLLGCSSGPATPRMRLGSIPFPGPFTLYSVADPAALGGHRYESWFDAHDGPSEVNRGILYTRRAGFLDLSHIRESMDIVKYAHDRIAEHFATGKSGLFRLDWADTRYDIRVQIPEWWAQLSEQDRADISREAAIRQAQRFCIVVGSWHELGTWYGQMTVPPFSEKPSAFTWDDPASHVVAAIVAGKALRDAATPWNAAVTKALNDELAELGVVDIDCESKAVEHVHGRWWWGGTAIRRDLDTGLATNIKTPWLITGLDCCATDSTAGLALPEMGAIAGRDLKDFFEIRIIPEQWLMRKALGCDSCPEALRTEREVVDAIERLRLEVKQEFGPEADQP